MARGTGTEGILKISTLIRGTSLNMNGVGAIVLLRMCNWGYFVCNNITLLIVQRGGIMGPIE